MKLTICAIYDTATEAYMRPFTSQSTGQATRMFLDLVNDETHSISKHPEDYSLFHIADFFDGNAKITEKDPIVCLGRAHELKNPKEVPHVHSNVDIQSAKQG